MSHSFRKIDSVVFGMFPHHDQMEHGQTTVFVGKGTNLIRLGAELSEKALNQVSRAHQWMQSGIQLVESETAFDAPGEVADGIGLQGLPCGNKSARRCSASGLVGALKISRASVFIA